ncbi:MAG TPA: hypothetical protein VK957_18160 [Lunatimonas sp.]|nr:hypothetical protein [Lunatimonas sp.]
MMAQDIEIYIERIVLEGFDHLNRNELNQAIQHHLTAMLTEQGLPLTVTGIYEVSKLNGGHIHLPSNPTTGNIGKSIAGGIYQGLKTTE